MEKRPNISPFRERLLSVLYMVALTGCLLFVANSCKNKSKDKGGAQQEMVNPSDSGYVGDLEYADFSFFRVKGHFLGTVDGKSCVLSIESAGKTKVTGKYYLIDSLSNSAVPVPFKLLKESDGYRFIAGSINEMATFSISADSTAILGTITTLGEQGETHRLNFKHYKAPAFRETKSTRYQKPQFSYSMVSDVQYGKAKGFWTSYPMENDINFTKVFLKLLPKTVASKPQNLTLDLYIPENDSVTKHPLFVLLHGGAYFVGDKGTKNMRGWCEHFAQSGYVVASVNYRMGFAISKSSIQQCGYQAIQDAHAALRYLVAHAEEYHIDPDFVFVAGTSAGSITALATAFMNDKNCPQFVIKNKLRKKCGTLHTSGNEYRDNVKIRAVANMWGAVYDLHELDGHPVPMVSFHGTEDHIVPYDHGIPFSEIKSKIGEKLFDEMYGSKAIHDYLDSLHVRNKLYPLEGCGHAPHQEKDGRLNEHYQFIQGKMQEFFYPELKSKCQLKHDDHDPQLYCLEEEGYTQLSWQAEGGIILSTSDGGVRVVWLEDAPKHLLRASGFNAIGVPYKQEWKISSLSTTPCLPVEKYFSQRVDYMQKKSIFAAQKFRT